MLFLKKKNESIVCVGNWAQALHFIEQQISTCTVVATSVPSSLSPGLSVPHPILSLAYPCGKKSPLLVISRATKAQTVCFFFTCPTSQWVKLSKNPQALREATFALLKSLLGSLHYVLSLPFLFFWGKKEIRVWWHRSWCLECLCAVRCPPNAAVWLGTGDRVEFFFAPLPVVESLSHTMSDDLCPWRRAGTGTWVRLRRGTGCSDPPLFIVSMAGLNEEGRN